MAIHPADAEADNPRLQCVVCAKWKRLHTSKPRPPLGLTQTFMGGCSFNNDNRHLAAKEHDDDVCEKCCHEACKAIAEARLRCDAPIDGGDAASDGRT